LTSHVGGREAARDADEDHAVEPLGYGLEVRAALGRQIERERERKSVEREIEREKLRERN
jgi:hypothetical protein